MVKIQWCIKCCFWQKRDSLALEMDLPNAMGWAVQTWCKVLANKTRFPTRSVTRFLVHLYSTTHGSQQCEQPTVQWGVICCQQLYLTTMSPFPTHWLFFSAGEATYALAHGDVVKARSPVVPLVARGEVKSRLEWQLSRHSAERGWVKQGTWGLFVFQCLTV